MTPARRTRLSRWATLSSRASVYQTADALEIDSSEQFEIVRRRVLFEDVRLVTFHRERGWAYVITMAVLALFFFGIGVFIAALDTSNWIAALSFALIGAAFFTALVIRLALGVDVVTAFGRRSKAVMRFSFRKQRAREVYGLVCAAARAAQRIRPATFPGSVAQPLPEDVPLPPL